MQGVALFAKNTKKEVKKPCLKHAGSNDNQAFTIMKTQQKTKNTQSLIRIVNDGAEIIETNFRDTDWNEADRFLLSPHSGALRLICPTAYISQIPEMQTANKVLVSYGVNQKHHLPMIEVLFEDDSVSPLVLSMDAEQSMFSFWIGNPPNPIPFSVWTIEEETPIKVLELDCWIRIVPKIPWLKPL